MEINIYNGRKYKMTDQEIKIAKSTSRSAGATAIKDGKIRAVVPLWVENNIDKNKTILDFGAGKGAVSTKYLIDKGFNVTAYDLWCGEGDKLLDPDALSRQYDIVFASNVLNVQSSIEMLVETLSQIYHSVNTNGYFICNYPQSPRKLTLNINQIIKIIENIFNANVQKAFTSSATILIIKK